MRKKMNETVELYEVQLPEDIEYFWKLKNEYFFRDIIPDTDIGGPMTEEDIAYFLSKEYHDHIEMVCSREKDRATRVFFKLNGEIIGFCLYATYLSEDAKCFIIDYCILPESRNKGKGKDCVRLLIAKTQREGAQFFELNTHCHRAKKFWESVGFQYNGYDSYGSILLLYPPESSDDIVCEELQLADIWQLLNLENSYKVEINKPFLTKAQQDSLLQAISDNQIKFFLLKRSTRAIGMCSVSKIFSTFNCASIGIFADFFIEPVFRKNGYERLLTKFVQDWCYEQRINSLLVGSSDTDLKKYTSLGFDVKLGNLLKWSIEAWIK